MVRYCTGFERGNNAQDIDIVGAFANLTTTNPISLGWSLRINPTSTNLGYGIVKLDGTGAGTKVSPITASDSWSCRFKFRADTLPSTNRRRMWQANTAADAHVVILTINPSGQLDFIGGGSNQETGWSSLALVVGTVYTINVIFTRSTDMLQLFVNGVNVYNVRNIDLGATNATDFLFGDSNNGAPEFDAVDWYYDDIIIRDDAQYIPSGTGNVAIVNANGTYTAWTGAFGDVDDYNPDDGTTTEISTTGAGNLESYLINPPNRTGDLINAVSIGVMSRKSSVSSAQYQFLSRLRGSDELSATIDVQGTTYGATSICLFAPTYQPIAFDLSTWEIGVKSITVTATPSITQVIANIDYADPSQKIMKENELRPALFSPGLAR